MEARPARERTSRGCAQEGVLEKTEGKSRDGLLPEE